MITRQLKSIPLTVNVGNSGVNPYLVNPIKAVYNGQDVGISHAIGQGIDITVIIQYADGKSSNAPIRDVMILNDHELSRFETMVEWLKQLRYIHV